MQKYNQSWHLEQSCADTTEMKQTTHIAEINILKSVLGKTQIDRLGGMTVMQYHHRDCEVYKNQKERLEKPQKQTEDAKLIQIILV